MDINKDAYDILASVLKAHGRRFGTSGTLAMAIKLTGPPGAAFKAGAELEREIEVSLGTTYLPSSY